MHRVTTSDDQYRPTDDDRWTLKRYDDFRSAAIVQARPVEEQTDDEPLLPNHLCENEAERHEWRMIVLETMSPREFAI